jgi:hypothetical protein
VKKRSYKRLAVTGAETAMKALLTGTAILLVTASAHAAEGHWNDYVKACELRIEIEKWEDGFQRLRFQEYCSDKKTLDEYYKIRHPRNCTRSHQDESDACRTCSFEGLERIDQRGYLVHTYCENRPANKRSTLQVQITDMDTIMITNAENY